MLPAASQQRVERERYAGLASRTSTRHHSTSASLMTPFRSACRHLRCDSLPTTDVRQGRTAFLETALTQGALRLADGLGMLVEQRGIFLLWRGVRPQTRP